MVIILYLLHIDNIVSSCAERMESMSKQQIRTWYPYIGIFDPCPPIREKSYVLPPNLFIRFQPPCLPQFPVSEALYRGTLWPIFYSTYPPRRKGHG